MNHFKLGFAISILVSASAMAEVTVQRFYVIRNGGGDIRVGVAKNAQGQPSIWVEGCNFKTLSKADQAKTTVALSGKDGRHAQAILNNSATLGQEVLIQAPGATTGTWSKLEIAYEYVDFLKKTPKAATKEINAPLIVVDGDLSPVFSNIEKEGRDAAEAAGLCK